MIETKENKDFQIRIYTSASDSKGITFEGQHGNENVRVVVTGLDPMVKSLSYTTTVAELEHAVSLLRSRCEPVLQKRSHAEDGRKG